MTIPIGEEIPHHIFKTPTPTLKHDLCTGIFQKMQDSHFFLPREIKKNS